MAAGPPSCIEVRPYQSTDADATLAVFLDAVQVTAAADYSPRQIAAWARPGQRSARDWDRAMTGRDSLVAVIGDEVVGFSDVSAHGYIDMLFVSPRHGRRGVARSLLTAVEARARATGARRLSADVSITARPFFERCGFTVTAEQHPVAAGVRLTNFHMVKPMDADAVT